MKTPQIKIETDTTNHMRAVSEWRKNSHTPRHNYSRWTMWTCAVCLVGFLGVLAHVNDPAHDYGTDMDSVYADDLLVVMSKYILCRPEYHSESDLAMANAAVDHATGYGYNDSDQGIEWTDFYARELCRIVSREHNSNQ